MSVMIPAPTLCHQRPLSHGCRGDDAADGLCSEVECPLYRVVLLIDRSRRLSDQFFTIHDHFFSRCTCTCSDRRTVVRSGSFRRTWYLRLRDLSVCAKDQTFIRLPFIVLIDSIYHIPKYHRADEYAINKNILYGSLLVYLYLILISLNNTSTEPSLVN